MAKKDQLKDTLEDAIRIGRSNAAKLPEIRNWCRHIVLKNESAGLVAEFYQLPITIAVSCPHAGGSSTGMQLNWIASSFILENCIGCRFHQHISEPNFGSRLLDEKRRNDEAAAIELEKKNQTKQQLRDHIEVLIKKRKSNAGITELSILQITDGLSDDGRKVTNAVQIFEASKIDPELFTPLSLDAISLYFEDEQIGGLCMQTVSKILNIKTTFPDLPYQLAIKTLRSGKHFNDAALLLRFYINTENIEKQQETIVLLLENLTYQRMIGDPIGHERDYGNSIEAIRYLIGLSRPLMQTLFRRRLGSEDTLTRIDTNYCLQDLMDSNYTFVKELTSDLIKSFQLVDDATYDSADLACARTLGKLIKFSPVETYPEIKAGISQLNSAGRGGAIRLFHYLFNETDFVASNKDFCEELVKDIIGLAMNENDEPELREDYVDELHNLRYDSIDLLEPSYDAFLGWLSQLAEREKTFLWWLNELEKKKPEEVTTYNPLLGKNYLDIDRERNKISREITHIADVLREILKRDKGFHLQTTRTVLEGLNSRTHTKLKTTLIDVISRSVEDPFILAQFIPVLYSYLFDPDEVKIREEAMRFLGRLVDNHPQLITQNLFDIAELFLKDPEVSVRGLAIEIQASIQQKIPEKFNPGNLDTLINCMLDSYVYVHKRMALSCRIFFPIMNKQQQIITIINLLNIVDHYYKKDQSFFQNVIKDYLAISREIPSFFDIGVKKYLIPDCESNEYYVVKESIELLGEIKAEKKQFEDDWLRTVIELFKKIHPGFRADMEWRSELYNEMYSLSHECLQRNIEIITAFLESRTLAGGFDIINTLQVLAYFEMHHYVVAHVEGLSTRISQVRATDWIFRHANIIGHFSAYEESVGAGCPSSDHLKTIRNALQEYES